MINFEVIIGIEVHTVLNTKTKMFSPAKNDHHSLPNTNVNVIDLGLPGIMPQPNANAIKKGIWLAKELNMKIDYENIIFDRKNYFYIDLPKGFQITQQYHPIGRDGTLKTSLQEVLIERIHLEEDTAKQFTKDNKIYLDYNRCGSPLIEIVTRPCMHSAEEAMAYLTALKQMLQFNNISDAKMEDGSLRADVNISLRPFGQKAYGTKVEIKNINSISNVGKAIHYEIMRQQTLLLTGSPVIQETRRFDDKLMQTIHMREKTDAVSYRYIVEPNITRIKLAHDEFETILNEKPMGIDALIDSLKNFGLKENEIELLLNDFDLYKAFVKLNTWSQDPLNSFKWLSQDLAGLLKKDGLWFDQFSDDKLRNIAQMLKLLNEEEINGKQAKVILNEIYVSNKDPQTIIKEQGFIQIKDEKVIEQYLKTIIEKNPDMLKQYEERAERVEKFYIGLLMKETNGQSNPNVSMKVLKYLLKNTNH